VQYQSDYILRLIEQMGSLIRRALEAERGGGGGARSYELAEEAIGLALDIDPATAARLSPESFAALLELSNLDDRVVSMIAEALDVESDALEASGELGEARLRREQSTAARELIDRERPN